ncbi:MAG: hypothetical protein WCO93_00795 [bacterium]
MKTFLIFLMFIAGLNPTLRAQQKNPQGDTVKTSKTGILVVTTTVDLQENREKPGNITGSADKQVAALIFPMVDSIASLRPKRTSNLVVVGDYIVLRIDNRNRFEALRDSLKRSNPKDSVNVVILYIDGKPIPEIRANENPQSGEFVFYLDRDSKTLRSFNPYFPSMFSTCNFKFSLGFRNGPVLPNREGYRGTTVRILSVSALVSAILLVVIILGIVVFLSHKTDLIRIGDNKSQFSLGLTQLIFWTVIIASSYFYLWILNKEPVSMADGTLILLGISIATTTGSKLVDFRRKTPVPVQVPSRGFWTDIASDSLGFSVHRCQMILWTIILSIVFIQNVIVQQKIPDLDPTLLALMGISSAGFVGLKTMENKE